MLNDVKSIHYLRGLAALLVVFHHGVLQFPGLRDRYAHFEFGQAGVDIFFVISGFVIYLASIEGRIRPGEFVKRRIVRIVPLYWVATLALVAAAVCAPQLFATTVVTPQNVGQSLLFIPSYSAAFPDQIWPVLVPGWSLNYEMFFYGLFALGLMSGARAFVDLSRSNARSPCRHRIGVRTAVRSIQDLHRLEAPRIPLGVLLARYYLDARL